MRVRNANSCFSDQVDAWKWSLVSVNSYDVLAQLCRSTDVPCTRAPAEHLCHAYRLGCHVRLPFSSSSYATHVFDLVHYDLWTSPVLSLSGYKYYLVVVDDFSHYSWTLSLRAKSETFTTLLHFFAWVSTQFGHTIKAVQCDNGREFDNYTSRSFFLSRGVQLRMSGVSFLVVQS